MYINSLEQSGQVLRRCDLRSQRLSRKRRWPSCRVLCEHRIRQITPDRCSQSTLQRPSMAASTSGSRGPDADPQVELRRLRSCSVGADLACLFATSEADFGDCAWASSVRLAEQGGRESRSPRGTCTGLHRSRWVRFAKTHLRRSALGSFRRNASSAVRLGSFRETGFSMIAIASSWTWLSECGASAGYSSSV